MQRRGSQPPPSQPGHHGHHYHHNVYRHHLDLLLENLDGLGRSYFNLKSLLLEVLDGEQHPGLFRDLTKV